MKVISLQRYTLLLYTLFHKWPLTLTSEDWIQVQRMVLDLSHFFMHTWDHSDMDAIFKCWYFEGITDTLEIKAQDKAAPTTHPDPRVIQDIASLKLLFDTLIEYDATMKQLVRCQNRTNSGIYKHNDMGIAFSCLVRRQLMLICADIRVLKNFLANFVANIYSLGHPQNVGKELNYTLSTNVVTCLWITLKLN